ncbi:MAG: DNA-binding protein [Bryobacteraceae bacterium]
MNVVALPEFLTRAQRLLSKEERSEFADYIGANPEAGKVIPGLKGVRKVRWGRANVGKRRGVRIICLYVVVKSTVYFTLRQNSRISRPRREGPSSAVSPR